MSTLSVTNIITANNTTDLTVKTGNSSGPQMVLRANGEFVIQNVTTFDSLLKLNAQNVTQSYTIPTGYGAYMVGPIVVANGITLAVANTARFVVL